VPGAGSSNFDNGAPVAGFVLNVADLPETFVKLKNRDDGKRHRTVVETNAKDPTIRTPHLDEINLPSI